MRIKEKIIDTFKAPRSRRILIISAAVLVICTAVVSVAMYVTRDKSTVREGIYKEQPLPDYTRFLPENAIKAMFDDKGGCAYLRDAGTFYENGEYKTADTPPCVSEGGELRITTDIYGTKTPEELAKAMGTEYVVYDGRLAVFSYKKDFADVYSDIYTLEALSLRLSGAGEADIVNAFITLPNFISNGTTNSVYYTEPNLNLGVQTELYSLELDGFDTGFEKVDKAPAIVAGQGEDSANHTLIRIFNESQACTAQFLAFPPDITGGVQVKTGISTGGSPLIVAASFDTIYNSAKCIKVFDTFGTLRYTFTPKDTEPPYVIEVGHFTGGENERQIFVASKFSGSDTHYSLYSLDDGSFISDVKCGAKGRISAQRITLDDIAPSENGGRSRVLITFLDSKDVYYIDCESSEWTDAGIKLDDNATGVYGSAFDGGLIASLSENTFSNVRIYGSGVSEGLEGSLLNVGYKENRFYSTYAEDNPDGYVDYASFLHIRTDLSNGVIGAVGDYSGKDMNSVTEIMRNASYYDWQYTLSGEQKKTFHEQYNVWEPCFTHRWNSVRATQNLVSVTDSETNFPKYASIGRDNFSSDYKELDSSFLVGTYADGIIDLAKLRIYPLRTMLQQLASEFRGENGEPERLIDVSPVHEQEINVAGSVGDYNPKMIEGFRKYLLGLYGSVENINERFGTDFASESDIDAPRYDPEGTNQSESRGKWDEYGNSDYFTQWSLYTRNIVNKRIIEAYREALIAGFPPEAINAHQIPEGDAVSGFLGEADTRISPTDVVSICGTAYGGTRYGYFCNDVNNFIRLAYGAGHYNITLGEYSSLAQTPADAYAQLKYLFDNGVKFTHIIVPYAEKETVYTLVRTAELEAIARLQENNAPRTASTGGTGASKAVIRGDKSYNIVQLGDADKNGLLKSVNEDGSWEGSVYVVPFHSNVTVNNVKMNECEGGYVSAPIKNLQYGDQAELTFLASYEGSDEADAYVEIQMYHAGCPIEDSKAVYSLTSETVPYRYVVSNQIALENVEIRVTFKCGDVSKIRTDDIQLTAQIEDAAHKYFGMLTVAPEKGGVTFDIIE